MIKNGKDKTQKAWSSHGEKGPGWQQNDDKKSSSINYTDAKA